MFTLVCIYIYIRECVRVPVYSIFLTVCFFLVKKTGKAGVKRGKWWGEGREGESGFCAVTRRMILLVSSARADKVLSLSHSFVDFYFVSWLTLSLQRAL